MVKLLLASVLPKLTSRKFWALVAADSLAVTHNPLWSNLPPRYQWVRGLVFGAATVAYIIAEAVLDIARARSGSPAIPPALLALMQNKPTAPPPGTTPAPLD